MPQSTKKCLKVNSEVLVFRIQISIFNDFMNIRDIIIICTFIGIKLR